MENCSVDESEAANSSIVTQMAEDRRNSFKIKAAIFLTGISGLSIFGGFAYTLASARKTDPEMFDQAVRGTKQMPVAGSTLALRALGWGSLYAVSGVTLICYLIWKLSGAEDMQDFRRKVGKVLPDIPKNKPAEGRTEFANLTDLLQYIVDEDQRLKEKSTEYHMSANEK